MSAHSSRRRRFPQWGSLGNFKSNVAKCGTVPQFWHVTTRSTTVTKSDSIPWSANSVEDWTIVTRSRWLFQTWQIRYNYMGVSKNRGTPKSSILIGFSIIHHPFWEYQYFWKHPYRIQLYNLNWQCMVFSSIKHKNAVLPTIDKDTRFQSTPTWNRLRRSMSISCEIGIGRPVPLPCMSYSLGCEGCEKMSSKIHAGHGQDAQVATSTATEGFFNMQ